MDEAREPDQTILEKTIHFPEGIPGFPEHKNYVFTQTPEERPFAWMRSLDDEWLAFPAIEVFHLAPDYSFEVGDQELKKLGIESMWGCMVMAIVRIEPGSKIRIHANLRAPLIIHPAGAVGRQVILPDGCGHSDSAIFEF